MKKFISLFLAALMLCASAMAAPAPGEAAPAVLAASAPDETAHVCCSKEEAYAYLREKLIARETDFYFGCDWEGAVELSEEDVLAYAGSDAEAGDYLRFHLAALNMEITERTVHVTAEYRSSADEEAQVRSAVAQALAEMDAARLTDARKAIAVFDWLRRSVTYAEGDGTATAYTAYGALVNKAARCEGIALAYYRLARALGLDCRILAGELTENGETDAHAWNAVKLGESWYHVDVTNAIAAADPYECFMMPLTFGDAAENGFALVVQYQQDIDNTYYTADEIQTYPFDAPLFGVCGENAAWGLDPISGVLEIDGSGALYACTEEAPMWLDYAELISTAHVADGITALSDGCFDGCDLLLHCAEASAAQAFAQENGVAFHLLNRVERVPSTCVTPGTEVRWECADCGAAFGGETIPVRDERDAHRDANGDGECDDCGTLIDAEAKGVCGDAIHWYFVNSCELVLKGTGPMYDYSTGKTTSAPWADYRNSIKKITVREGITTIGGYAFYKCAECTQVDLPESLTSIGRFSFDSAKKLETLSMPSSLTTIGPGAFNFTGLRNLVIPKSVTSTGRGVSNVVETIEFEPGTKMIPHNICMDAKLLHTVIVPDSVTVIGEEAFSGCKALTSFSISSSITAIGFSAFSGTGIEEIFIPKTVKRMGASSYSGLVTLGVFGLSALKKIVFEDGITKIFEAACEGASNLTEVVLPASATEIGAYAFRGCKNLTSIDLPEEITKIGGYAFSGTSIAGIELPENLKTLGDHAFNGCKSLTAIELPEGITKIDNGVFYGCAALSSVRIPSAATAIGGYAFKGCASLEGIHLPERLVSIGDQAFHGCAGIAAFSLPETVQTIGSSAFENCKGLSFIQFPASLETVNSSAFRGCERLTSVWIPSATTVFKTGVFTSCPSNLVIHCLPESNAAAYAEAQAIPYHTDLSFEPVQMDLCSGAANVEISVRCNECGWAIAGNRVLDGSGHTVVIDPEVPATCTAAGLSAGAHCGVCGAILTSQTEIPAKGHAETPMADIAPTCIANGRTGGTECSVCGTVLVSPGILPKTGHTVVIDAAVPATCTQTGLSEGSHCSVCGKTLQKQKTEPAVGHKDTLRAGELPDGVCDVCGEKIEESLIMRIIHRIGAFFEGWSRLFSRIFRRKKR